MKILFVYTEINIKFGTSGFQNGIASLSAYLKYHGYHDIHLCNISSISRLKTFRQTISSLRPEIIGFYTSHDQFRFIQGLVSEVDNPSVFTICGGPHATLNPEIIYDMPRLDAVCIGEGEEALLRLAQTLEKRERPSSIPNLWIRHEEKIIKNIPRPFLDNIDDLPFADRDIFSKRGVWKQRGLTQISYENSFRISRGCPFPCTFCSNKQIALSQTGRYVRFRSVDNILSEIKDVVRKYSPHEIYFQDDTFTINKNFIDEFCKKYPPKIGLPFEFLSHIGPSTIEILCKLREAGGRRVSFGIESGNERLRREILNKDFGNDEIKKIFKEVKKMGYHTEAFALIGIPGETLESFNDTIRLFKAIQPDLYTLCVFFPYQGTDLYNYCVKKGYVDSNFIIPGDFVPQRDAMLNMPEFSKRQIITNARLFPFKIYKNSSLVKALFFSIYEFRFGNKLLKSLAFCKRKLRRFIIGVDN